MFELEKDIIAREEQGLLPSGVMSISLLEAAASPSIEHVQLTDSEFTLPDTELLYLLSLSQETIAAYTHFLHSSEHLSLPVLPFFSNSAFLIRCASPEVSHKHKGMFSQFGGTVAEKRKGTSPESTSITQVKYIPNGFVEEQWNKVLNNGRDISLMKSYMHFAGVGLERKHLIDQFEKSHTRYDITGRILLSGANDVTQEIRGNGQVLQQHQRDFIQEGTDEKDLYQVKADMWHAWRKRYGVESPFQENGMVRINMLSTTSLYEARHNVGGVKENETNIYLQVLSDEDITALIWGVYDDEHPVSDETRQKYLAVFHQYVSPETWKGQYNPDTVLPAPPAQFEEVPNQSYTIADRIRDFGWSPQFGFDHRIVMKVGGIQIQNPMYRHHIREIDGVLSTEGREFEEKLQRMAEIAAGFPREITFILHTLIDDIVSQYLMEEYQPMYTAAERDGALIDLTHLKAKGLQVGGRWLDLNNLKKESINASKERAQKIYPLMSAYFTYLTRTDKRRHAA